MAKSRAGFDSLIRDTRVLPQSSVETPVRDEETTIHNKKGVEIAGKFKVVTSGAIFNCGLKDAASGTSQLSDLWCVSDDKGRQYMCWGTYTDSVFRLTHDITKERATVNRLEITGDEITQSNNFSKALGRGYVSSKLAASHFSVPLPKRKKAPKAASKTKSASSANGTKNQARKRLSKQARIEKALGMLADLNKLQQEEYATLHALLTAARVPRKPKGSKDTADASKSKTGAKRRGRPKSKPVVSDPDTDASNSDNDSEEEKEHERMMDVDMGEESYEGDD